MTENPSQRVPYQGYPYVNPAVIDVSPLSPAEVPPNVTQQTTQGLPYLGFPYVNPPVIDVPSLNPDQIAALAKWQNLPRRQLCEGSSRENLVSDAVPSSSSSDKDEDRPVVYIDIPESNDSLVSETRQEAEPEFVQETILYDPFKNQRIEMSSPSEAGPSSSSGYTRPQPPSSLNVGSSSNYSSPPPSSSAPSFLSKESYVYGRQPTPDNALAVSPMSDFPAPPPPYEEVPSLPQVVETPAAAPEQPRTQVIVSNNTTSPIVLDGARKLAHCPYCRTTVQTIVVKQSGFWTHVMAAILFLLCLIPLLPFVYCMDRYKYKCHYCPQCNRKLAQESPAGHF